MNAEIPGDLFADLEQVAPAKPGPHAPSVAQRWYDGIIDDILANPGTTVKDTAARLGRHPHTISAITNSDLFKSRWEQRRKAFSLALDLHLSQKLAQVAEKALDHTIAALDRTQDKTPLPMLKDLAMQSLDRLGYSPSRSESPATSVNVNVQSGSASQEGLAHARRQIELSAKRHHEVPPPVAGSEEEPGPRAARED
jgi:hypothetical protein